MALSERMQLDKDPTLQKTVTMARQSEAVKIQQPGKFKPCTQTKQRGLEVIEQAEQPTCHKCGNTAPLKWQCPAKNVVCHTYGKKTTFNKVCRVA